MMIYMKRIIFLVTLLLVGFSPSSYAKEYKKTEIDYQLINSSEVKEFLHVSLQIDDFYNPFLTRRENEDFKKNFPQKNIKILAEYEAIIDKTGSIIKKNIEKSRASFLSLKGILGVDNKLIVYNKINQIAFATNLQIDKKNQIINFDIPKPTMNDNQQYILKNIYFHYPDFQTSESRNFPNIDTDKYILIFRNKFDINNQLNGSEDRFRHVKSLNFEIETDKFVDRSVDIPKELLVRKKVLNTSVWFSNDKPIKKKLLSNEEKNDLFDNIRIEKDYQQRNFLVRPDLKLSWSNIERSAGVFLKGKTFEVLKLEGRLSRNRAPNKDKYGLWIKQEGDLIYVKHGFNGDGECDFTYLIVFEKGSQNQPRKYIVMHSFDKYRFYHSIDRRIDITRENLSFFEELKQQKKEWYDNELKRIQKFYADEKKQLDHTTILRHQNSEQACMREIDIMKKLLTMPKEHLIQEFEQYKEIFNKIYKLSN